MEKNGQHLKSYLKKFEKYCEDNFNGDKYILVDGFVFE